MNRVQIAVLGVTVLAFAGAWVVFSSSSAPTPQVVQVASKIDAANKDKLAKLKRYCKKRKLELFEISAVTGAGIEALKWAMAKKVVAVRRELTQPAEESAELF